METSSIRHSVVLDSDACRGCTNCIKRCPVEAIRVRKSKASIIAERCIDCGECIRMCPHKAKKADSDQLSSIKAFDYAIALPAPAFFAQFDALIPTSDIVQALLSLGFHSIVEVAEAAELVATATAAVLSSADRPRPLISASCPAVVRLIQVRYPSLLENMAKVISPMETAARIAKERAREAGLHGRIGAFFISPCPAKVTAARAPLSLEKSEVDGVVSFKDIHIPMLEALSHGRTGIARTCSDTQFRAGAEGIAWARSEGESEKHQAYASIAVDGIDRVIFLLEEIENGALSNVDFVEALACPGGCVGGPLVVTNPSLARTRVRGREEERKRLFSGVPIVRSPIRTDLDWTVELSSRPALLLHADFRTASSMLEELERIAEKLPGLDCGSCGAPSCRALAEDIVRGTATPHDCIFILRERLRGLTRELMDLEDFEPPSLDHGST
ncbi:MAG: [Fe-Fe] hydrogenase large subunit C-terminal domain-containing protein [Treponemataceae bacterium]